PSVCCKLPESATGGLTGPPHCFGGAMGREACVLPIIGKTQKPHEVKRANQFLAGSPPPACELVAVAPPAGETAAATRPLFARLRLVDRQRSALEHRAVEGRDRLVAAVAHL